MTKVKEILFKKIDYLNLAIALIIAVLPWNIWLNSLLILMFSSTLIIYTIVKKRKIVIDWKHFILSSMLFWMAVVWLVVTSDIKLGLKYIEHSLSALIFPLIFSIIINQYKLKINYILLIFLAGVVLRYLLFLFNIIEFELIFIIDYWKEIFIQFNQLSKLRVMHPSYFSMYLGFCSLISYGYYTTAKTTKNKIFWIFLMIITFVFNVTLTAKMPLIGTIISLITLFIFHTMKSFQRKSLIKITLFIVGFSAILLTYFKNIPNSLIQDINNYYKIVVGEKIDDQYDYNKFGANSTLETWKQSNRIYIWESGIDVMRENLIFGVGTGDIKKKLNDKYEFNDKKYLADKNTNTHNQYLDYIIRYGILGFIVILICFFFYLKIAFISLDYLYFAFLVLIYMSMLTENILNRQYGIVFFFFLNSAFYFLRTEKSQGIYVKKIT